MVGYKTTNKSLKPFLLAFLIIQSLLLVACGSGEELDQQTADSSQVATQQLNLQATDTEVYPDSFTWGLTFKESNLTLVSYNQDTHEGIFSASAAVSSEQATNEDLCAFLDGRYSLYISVINSASSETLLINNIVLDSSMCEQNQVKVVFSFTIPNPQIATLVVGFMKDGLLVDGIAINDDLFAKLLLVEGGYSPPVVSHGNGFSAGGSSQ